MHRARKESAFIAVARGMALSTSLAGAYAAHIPQSYSANGAQEVSVRESADPSNHEFIRLHISSRKVVDTYSVEFFDNGVLSKTIDVPDPNRHVSLSLAFDQANLNPKDNNRIVVKAVEGGEVVGRTGTKVQNVGSACMEAPVTMQMSSKISCAGYSAQFVGVLSSVNKSGKLIPQSASFYISGIGKSHVAIFDNLIAGESGSAIVNRGNGILTLKVIGMTSSTVQAQVSLDSRTK